MACQAARSLRHPALTTGRTSDIERQALEAIWKSTAQERIGCDESVPIEELRAGAKFPNEPEKNKTALQPSLEGRLGKLVDPAKMYGNHLGARDNLGVINISTSIFQHRLLSGFARQKF
jgi:hypothetical protein